jgi:hypothetical protein
MIKDLYLCYETFYHPSNMVLFVVGDVNPENIRDIVETHGVITFVGSSTVARSMLGWFVLSLLFSWVSTMSRMFSGDIVETHENKRDKTNQPSIERATVDEPTNVITPFVSEEMKSRRL